MAIKKTELYSSLWASCDELRGGMDASQYKDYVLTMLFMKYVSDKYKGDPYGMIVVPQGASFDDMVALKGDKEIGDKINKVISALAEENDLKGVIDVADFNDEDKLGKGKEMIDRLSKLIGTFEGLNLSANRADGDDLLGDAYEYLMRHFATESGKSKGQFYTPSEVSRILSKVIGIKSETPQDATVYDPTCGSGSLLLKASDEAPRGLSIFGQEMDNATSALARMNMILHNNATAKIWKGNTISDPQWKEANGQLKTFDFAVANPPFSSKNWTSGINPQEDEFGRFTWGVPPEKNGDYAFLLHIIKSLKSTGKGAVILPHGVLFRGNAEARIRKNLIKQGYIKGIIGLPANLFYGTGIPACIIVIDKENSHVRKGIFMVDASKGFMKDGNKNRLRAQDIHKIVDVFTKQLEQPRYSRMVPLSEIATNNYNLNIPRYIDSSEPEDLHDLSAPLQGGIPNRDIDALAHYWHVFPGIRACLFKPAREGYSQASVKAAEVKNTILNHQEFKTYATESLKPFTDWATHAELKSITKGDQPKTIIHRISEDLLARYADTPLLDKYDVYQILMDYWAEEMQDDVYVLVQDGWQAGRVLRELVAKKGEKLKEQPDLVIGKTKYKAELILPELIVARFFAAEQAEIEALQNQLDHATQTLDSLIEEHSGEEGVLSSIGNKKEANLALNEFYELAWKGLDRSSYMDYLRLKQAVNTNSDRLVSMKAAPIFRQAENVNGTITLKKIKAILVVAEESEKKQLQAYLDLDKEIKNEKKALKLLLEKGMALVDAAVNDGSDALFLDEIRIIKSYLAYLENVSTAKAALKKAQYALDLAVFKQYSLLSEDEIKTLIVEDKWLAILEANIVAEIERVTQQLANRVKELEERYAESLPAITQSVEDLSAKVADHLKAMGLEWAL